MQIASSSATTDDPACASALAELLTHERRDVLAPGRLGEWVVCYNPGQMWAVVLASSRSGWMMC